MYNKSPSLSLTPQLHCRKMPSLSPRPYFNTPQDRWNMYQNRESSEGARIYYVFRCYYLMVRTFRRRENMCWKNYSCSIRGVRPSSPCKNIYSGNTFGKICLRYILIPRPGSVFTVLSGKPCFFRETDIMWPCIVQVPWTRAQSEAIGHKQRSSWMGVISVLVVNMRSLFRSSVLALRTQ